MDKQYAGILLILAFPFLISVCFSIKDVFRKVFFVYFCEPVELSLSNPRLAPAKIGYRIIADLEYKLDQHLLRETSEGQEGGSFYLSKANAEKIIENLPKKISGYLDRKNKKIFKAKHIGSFSRILNILSLAFLILCAGGTSALIMMALWVINRGN